MFMIYGFLSTVLFVLILPFWLFAGVFKPKLTAGFIEKLGFYKKGKLIFKKNKEKTILFYAVSVGEVSAIENLIKKTREEVPDTNIVIMTGTSTGQQIAKKKLGEVADFITYFPFDFPFCIKNMLKKIQPSAIFVMETELWPNFAHYTHKNKIPFYIINARISDRTYNSYKKLKFVFKPILSKYTGIFPQSEQDGKKFVSLGAAVLTTQIMGNLKFDIKTPDTTEINFQKNTQEKIIIAGSTHFGEEEIILDVYKELKNEIPQIKLIIAPRHPERNNDVCELIKNLGLDFQKRSEQIKKEDKDPSNSSTLKSQVFLLDTLGELGKFYSLCDIAFVGGSFRAKGGDNNLKRGVGGHNPLEATIFGKPCVSGPSIHNFKDIYSILTSTQAGKVVQTKDELKKYLKKLLTEEEFYKIASQDCEKVFEQNKGALLFVIKVIKRVVL